MLMRVKKMQMRWIVSCILLTLKQLTCIYYTVTPQRHFFFLSLSVFISISYNLCPLDRSIGVGTTKHHIKNRHIQKKQPTDK